jgi:hypothetical protein
MKYKAISIYQPWASWIAEGFKTIETRTHSRFRGLVDQRIAICSTKKIDTRAGSLALPYTTIAGVINSLEYLDLRGVILCTAWVYKVGWLEGEHSKAAMIDCEKTRRFGLFLNNIEKLEKPIPVIGRLGVFEVDI